MDSKQLTLAILLCVLVLSLAYAYWAMPRQETAPPRPVVDFSNGSAGEGGVSSNSMRVFMDRFDEANDSTATAERDIFSFKRPKPKPRQVETQPEPVVVEPVFAPTPFEETRKALAKFTFLGFVEKGGEKTVFLSSSGEIFLAKRGDRFGINDEFEVIAIDENLLSIRRIGTPGQYDVPLKENEKLSPVAIQKAMGSLRVDGSSSLEATPQRMTPPGGPLGPHGQR